MAKITNMTPEQHLTRANWHLQRQDTVGRHTEAAYHAEEAARKSGKDVIITNEGSKFAFR